jgi:hypothetical protein
VRSYNTLLQVELIVKGKEKLPAMAELNSFLELLGVVALPYCGELAGKRRELLLGGRSGIYHSTIATLLCAVSLACYTIHHRFHLRGQAL